MKMKLFGGIFVACALFMRALSLKCFSCKDPTGTCTEEQACNPTQNLSCRTILGTLNSIFNSDKSVIYDCGSCIGNLSFNLGIISASTTESCCQSDLCNSQNITEEANTTLNGLECFTCPLFEACENPTTMVKCVGSQTRCLHSSIILDSFRLTVKGCSSETICQHPDVLKDYGVQTQQGLYCCRGTGCNQGSSNIGSVRTTPLNVVTANNYTSSVQSELVNTTNTATANYSTSTVRMPAVTPTNLVSSQYSRCFACEDPTGICTEQQVCYPARNLSCRTILGKLAISGDIQTFIIRDCGTCIGNLSFNGGTTSASMTESCCQSDLCNSQNITEEANSTLNGLECYTCPLFSACEDPTRTVKCAGAQTWCLHSSITFSSLVFTSKGCASETMCQNPDVLKDYGVQTQQDFYCCRGSGCNRGSSEGSLTSEPSNPVSNSSLRCFACEDAAGVCTDQHACDPAWNMHCRTILGKLTISGITQTSVIRDCGICVGNLSFNGGTFSASTIESCCQTDLCNHQTLTEEANTTLNGLECYVCPSILSRVCDNPTKMVKCVGTQTRCLHSSIRYNGQHNVTIKGCASESMCAVSDLLKDYSITVGPDFLCCAENGCNGGRTVVVQSTVQSTTNGKPSLQPHAALLAVPLLAAAPRLLRP